MASDVRGRPRSGNLMFRRACLLAIGGPRFDDWDEDLEIEPEPDPEYGDFWPEDDQENEN